MFIGFIVFMAFIVPIGFIAPIDIAFIAVISSDCPCTGVADMCRSLGAGELEDGAANGYPPVGDGDDVAFMPCPGGGDMDMDMDIPIPIP